MSSLDWNDVDRRLSVAESLELFKERERSAMELDMFFEMALPETDAWERWFAAMRGEDGACWGERG